nr:hypothetical protein Iba_chr12bCG2380 [Ipomoea batatas]
MDQKVGTVQLANAFQTGYGLMRTGLNTLRSISIFGDHMEPAKFLQRCSKTKRRSSGSSPI